MRERDYRSPAQPRASLQKKKTCSAAFSIFVFCKFFRMRAFKNSQKTKITKQSFAILLRRERDSNPRYSKEYNGFRDRPIRPLWHLSLRGQTKFVSMLRCGGERGIRTPGTLASSTVFKTAAFDHSAISPSGAKVLQIKFSANLFKHFFICTQWFYFQNIRAINQQFTPITFIKIQNSPNQKHHFLCQKHNKSRFNIAIWQ